jgi:predicted enzyme related to lactoylglutathione lyase
MNHIAHFSINTDDLPATRSFYENVFGWKFSPWGPPDFYMIDTGGEAVVMLVGSLQKRRFLVPDHLTHGYECTLAVESVEKTRQAIVENGGQIVMEITTLAGIGYLLFFADPGGNYVGAMQYDPKAE